MISESTISFERQGGSATVTMVANKVWEATSSETWCRVSPTLGDGTNGSNFTLSITCDANTTYDNRTCQITIVCAEKTATINVNQKEDYGLIVPKTKYEVSYEAKNITIEVQTNVDYSVEQDSDSRAWLKVVSSKGLTSNSISVSISENEKYSRLGTITITSILGEVVVTIIQEASPNIVVFEDGQFWAYCLAHVDKNRDGIVSKDEAKAVTVISIPKCDVYNLSGIECFSNLTTLYCYGNGITTLDVSKNTKLEYIYADGNPLSELDVSGCPALKELFCSREHPFGGFLTKLDVSKNPALTKLYCNKHGLELLDVSHNPLLSELSCYENNLSNLDVSGCIELTQLFCGKNHLTNLDLSNNKKLYHLDCTNNQLTSLDVSNTSMWQLSCKYNQLISLDISGTGVSSLDCNDSPLEILNARGCALYELKWDNHQLTSLDVRDCWDLRRLYCSSNQLTSLNVIGCSNLYDLRCGSNQLTNLDVSGCEELETLHCGNNQITSLDVGRCSKMKGLGCSMNQLSSLDVSNNASLDYLYCETNPYLTEIWLKTGQTIRDFTYDTNVATIYYK